MSTMPITDIKVGKRHRREVPLSQAECRGFLLHVESARWRYHRIGINIA
jgi:hypothetical protein